MNVEEKSKRSTPNRGSEKELARIRESVDQAAEVFVRKTKERKRQGTYPVLRKVKILYKGRVFIWGKGFAIWARGIPGKGKRRKEEKTRWGMPSRGLGSGGGGASSTSNKLGCWLGKKKTISTRGKKKATQLIEMKEGPRSGHMGGLLKEREGRICGLNSASPTNQKT